MRLSFDECRQFGICNAHWAGYGGHSRARRTAPRLYLLFAIYLRLLPILLAV